MVDHPEKAQRGAPSSPSEQTLAVEVFALCPFHALIGGVEAFGLVTLIDPYSRRHGQSHLLK